MFKHVFMCFIDYLELHEIFLVIYFHSLKQIMLDNQMTVSTSRYVIGEMDSTSSFFGMN
jgi:hypothetical protein